MSLRERFARFMQGRYGMDQMNQFITGFAFVLIILNFIVKSNILNFIILLLLVYLYVRMFSKNYSKRYAENEWFLKVSSPITGFFRKQKSHANQRKDYRLFKCPGCKQMVRVPKGKGKISIRCPKCQREFVKKS